MADTTSKRPAEAVKRPIESVDEDSESVPSVKKIKTLTDDAAVEKSPSIKGGMSKKAETEAASQSESGSGASASKRTSEILSETVQGLSPAKKRKVINAQGESGENVDKRLHRNEEMEKRKRRMKNRALLRAIMEQMEFYFCDSNLSKDRYLRKLYDATEDGYIELEVFNNFNKLQTLLKGATPLTILSKALKKSKLLEMNEDRTKVRRRTPLKEVDQEEVDRRTVYVEHLPTYASHAWVNKIFSPCGKVCYISLPVYQTSKDIKGFAFVEFSSPEEAGKACSMLNNPLPTKTEDKPGKFPKGNKFLYRAQKMVPSVKVDEPDSNEENLQSDSKEEQVVSPTKKKKKKGLKKKGEELIEKPSNTEQVDSQDEKKKKKKKRKKQTPHEEGTGEPESSRGESCMEEEASSKETGEVIEEKNKQVGNNVEIDEKVTKKKKKRKKSKKSNAEDDIVDTLTSTTTESENPSKVVESENAQSTNMEEDSSNNEVKLGRKERKRLRQEDIRKKKAEREAQKQEEVKEEVNDPESKVTSVKDSEKSQETSGKRARFDSFVSESSETDDSSKIFRKSDGSQLTSCLVKSKKPIVTKKVEFDPVPVTTEFVERKEVRRRKKQKRESLHLRVLSKKEWLFLREEYIDKQKSHMAALKESLRELRKQDDSNLQPQEDNGKKHVDLTNVFGTKRMKPTHDVKLAHLEELKFIPNVIVQWKCSHEINRNKIKTMFKEIPSDKIAYIEGKEEAKLGYIRFKDEASAEEFAKLSRTTDSFSARVLPKAQQAAYWERANQDRITKLSRKKNERGTERIARKVFEKNKATFHEKGSHIVFDNDDDDDDNVKRNTSYLDPLARENQQDLEESFLAIFRK